MIKFGHLLVLMMGLVIACKPQAKVEEQGSDSTQYSITKIEKKSGCLADDDTSRCIHIDLSYPVVANGSAAFKSYYNRVIDSLLANTVHNFNIESDTVASSSITLEAEINQLFANFETVAQESGNEGPNRWEVSCEVTIQMDNSQLLCLNITTYSYTGGAHPNEYTQLITIDKNARQIIPAEQFFANKEGTTKWLEAEFKRFKNLETSTDLEQKGYFLKDGKFFLPDNIGFCKDSIQFYFNDYEIASHAEGPSDLRFPIALVNNFLQSGLAEKLK